MNNIFGEHVVKSVIF